MIYNGDEVICPDGRQGTAWFFNKDDTLAVVFFYQIDESTGGIASKRYETKNLRRVTEMTSMKDLVEECSK